MSDLIRRHKAIKCIKWWFSLIQLNPDILIDEVISIPSEEPEIVRCRDCIYWNHQTDFTYCDRTVWYGTDADDFCSFAERKEDDI